MTTTPILHLKTFFHTLAVPARDLLKFDTGSQLLFRPISAAYEHRSLGIASHWTFES